MKEALPRVSAAGATCGAILAIHTAGNLLQWNPRVHGIVSEGLFDRQSKFHHMPDLDAKLVKDLFCEKLLAELLKNKRISSGLVSSMASWRHSGFSVHSTRAPADAQDPAIFQPDSQQRQINDETTTRVEEENRSRFGVLDTFAPRQRSERSGVLPFPIGSVSVSDFQHNSAPFQCSVCARREGSARHESDQGD